MSPKIFFAWSHMPKDHGPAFKILNNPRPLTFYNFKNQIPFFSFGFFERGEEGVVLHNKTIKVEGLTSGWTNKA